MHNLIANHKRILLGGLLLISGLILSGCTQFDIPGSANTSPRPATSAPLAYPPPASTVVPTQVGVAATAGYASINPTPAPDEINRIGAMVEVQSIPTPQLRFSPREERGDGSVNSARLFVRDIQTGHEIRLGDDNGLAFLEETTPTRIFWQYTGTNDDEAAPFKTGLYVYDVNTGQNVVIAYGTGYLGQVHVDGDWVIYCDTTDAQDNLIGVRLYNLATGEDRWLTHSTPTFGFHFPRDLYSLNDGKAAWVEKDTTGQQVIKVYDLQNQTTRTVTIPNPTAPYRISVSSNFIVWQDIYWRGYDLNRDGVFTIPGMPSGWEEYSHNISVVAEGEHLEWRVRNNDQLASYFTALVIPNP